MNISRGARVGVSVGVGVEVEVALGLGEMVQVGDGVLVGAMVAVRVSLDEGVRLGVGLAVVDRLQADNSNTMHKAQINWLSWILFSNGVRRCNSKKGVMIPDFSLGNSKSIIPISDDTLSGRGCPGHVA